MFNSKSLSSISPKVAILGALIVVVAVSGVALLFTRGGSKANGDPAMQPRAARLERVDGSVGIARAEDQDKQLDWTEATVNTPVSVGDRIYARDNAHASIALTGHHYVRLNPVTSLDVLSLEDRRTQLALRSGSALFEVGEFGPDEFYEVATPCGAVDFKEPGLYQIGMDGDNAIISVLSGLAQVVGQEGSSDISKGQVFTLLGATAAQALVSKLAPREAGNTVDDYYRYRYPSKYDGRYQDYDAYLNDPFYYDAYRTSASSQYLRSYDVPGLDDLDSYGDWVDDNEYGHCWTPRVSAGWAPYRSGSWDLDDLYGPSWVSSEPWGWAPYHYGRWAFVSQRWLWVPVEVRTRRPAYCPATVAFIPVGDQIAWVPLGPREDYAPRYYDNFRPRYLASQEVVRVVTVQNTFVNINAPGGVTVVPIRGFTRSIDPRELRGVDAGLVGRSRAVIDPFAVDGIRELAIRRDDGRRRLKFERREQDVLNTAVVASTLPKVLAARGNVAGRLRVEAVPEKRKANKLKINEATEATSFRRPDGLPQPLAQSQRMAVLASRAEQGDKSARREMRQLMREGQQAAQQPAANQQQAQQEQTRQQIKEQRRAERQQQAASAGQQAGSAANPASQAQQQQLKQQRKAERQQAAQQDAARQSQQQQQQKQQRKAERQQAAQQDAARQSQQQQQAKQQRKAERQQAAQQDAARQSQQQKQQRKAEGQQAAQQEQMRQQQMREQQTRQQRKEQKRKPPEASVQQQRQAQQQAAQSQLAQQQREQFKAQRRVERQQQAAPHAQQTPAAGGASPDKAQRKAEKAQRRPPQ